MALYYTSLSGLAVDSTTVQANGGAASLRTTSRGGTGTIVYQPKRDARPSVLISSPAGFRSQYGRTRIGEFGTVSAASGTQLTSTRAMRPGVLAGLTLVPDAENPSTTFTIVSNTASAITVLGDLTSSTGAGRTWYVSDYANRLENLTVEGDASVEFGFLDVANVFRVDGTTEVVGTKRDEEGEHGGRQVGHDA